MSNENCLSKELYSVFKWQVPQDEQDDNDIRLDEPNNVKLGEDEDLCNQDSDSTLFDDISTDVIPASFPSLGISNDHNGTLNRIHRQNQTEFLNQVEIISSDIADSLVISPKTSVSQPNPEIESHNKDTQLRYSLRRGRKRKTYTTNINKRRKHDESQALKRNQALKRANKVPTDIEALLRKLKNPDKLSLKERKCTISKVRQTLIDIRNETESMVRGQIPVPNKPYVQMLLKRNRKLCMHLTNLYEDFPCNSQKKHLEEVHQVRETVEDQLKGILELLDYAMSANRFQHHPTTIDYCKSTNNRPYADSSQQTKQHCNENTDNLRVHKDNTHPQDITYTVSECLPVFNKQTEQIESSSENISLSAKRSTIMERDLPIEIIDLTQSVQDKDQAALALIAHANNATSQPMKKYETPHVKKRVHFNLQSNVPKNETFTKHNAISANVHTQHVSNMSNQTCHDFQMPDRLVTKDLASDLSPQISGQKYSNFQTEFHTSQTSFTPAQNSSTLSNQIPVISTNDKPLEDRIIPSQQHLTNFSSIQNSAVIHSAIQNNSDPKHPVYVIIVNRNDNQFSTSSNITETHNSIPEHETKESEIITNESFQQTPDINLSPDIYNTSLLPQIISRTHLQSSVQQFSINDVMNRKKQSTQPLSNSPKYISGNNLKKNQSSNLFEHSQSSQPIPESNQYPVQQISYKTNKDTTLQLQDQAEQTQISTQSLQEIAKSNTDNSLHLLPSINSQESILHEIIHSSQGNVQLLDNQQIHVDGKITRKKKVDCKSPNGGKICSKVSSQSAAGEISTSQLTNFSNISLTPSLLTPLTIPPFPSENLSRQILYPNSQQLSESQLSTTDVTTRVSNDRHVSGTSTNHAQNIELNLLNNNQSFDEMRVSNESRKNSNENLMTTQIQTPSKNIILNKMQREAHFRNRIHPSSEQFSSWSRIIPPKLPWQMGETCPEYEIYPDQPDLPKLSCPLLQSLDEFKNFKIPKLPWED